MVSICLDVVSIEILISTPKKYQSRRSRKSRRFSKVSLDDREISIEIEISRFSLDIEISRFSLDIFVIICGFLEYFSISTEKYWIFTNISIEILVPNLICLHFVLQNWLQNGQKVREIQIFFKKSQQILIYLDKILIYLDKISIYLDKILIIYKYLEKSRFVSICLESLD